MEGLAVGAALTHVVEPRVERSLAVTGPLVGQRRDARPLRRGGAGSDHTAEPALVRDEHGPVHRGAQRHVRDASAGVVLDERRLVARALVHLAEAPTTGSVLVVPGHLRLVSTGNTVRNQARPADGGDLRVGGGRRHGGYQSAVASPLGRTHVTGRRE